jgi:hypothetical protein
MAGLEEWQSVFVAIILVLVILLFLQLMLGVTIFKSGLNAKTDGSCSGPTGNFGDGNYLRLESVRDDSGGALAYLPAAVAAKDSFAGSGMGREPPVFWNPGDMNYERNVADQANLPEGLMMKQAPLALGRLTTGYSDLTGVREGFLPKVGDGRINGQGLVPY